MNSNTDPSAGTKPAVPGTRLAGRSALLTGSTSGIGAAIAVALAVEGAHVVVSGRDGTRAKEVVEQIHALGGRADYAEADLAGTYADLHAFASTVTSLLRGRTDILVNNAGVYPVTAGSWMASTGSPGGAMYTATKAAAEQLTRAWAAEFGPAGVRVNTVAPGVTLTPGNQAYPGGPRCHDGGHPGRRRGPAARRRPGGGLPGLRRRVHDSRLDAVCRRRHLRHPHELTGP